MSEEYELDDSSKEMEIHLSKEKGIILGSQEFQISSTDSRSFYT